MGGVVDETAPTIHLEGEQPGWHKRGVQLTLSAEDYTGGVGVDFTEFKVDNGSWMRSEQPLIPAPPDHSNDGEHVISCRAVDRAGNVGAIQTATVRIDTTPPEPRALGPGEKSCRTGSTIGLMYSLEDHKPGSGSARVRIALNRIPLHGVAKLVTVRSVGAKATNHRYSYAFHCTLAAGYCLWMVKATDAAGNKSLTSVNPRSAVFKRVCGQLRVTQE
jgi:hypothetical protein